MRNRDTLAVWMILTIVAFGAVAFPYPVKSNSSPAGPVPPALMSAPLPAPLRTNLDHLLRAREYDRVEQLLLSIIRQRPNSSPLLTLLGDVFFLHGKYLNCAVAMKKADAIAPIDIRSRFLLAMAYVAMNHPDWARPELQKLCQANPQNAVYPYWLSRLEYHDMRFGEAVTEVNKAIRLNPRFMKAYDNLGLYEEGLGRDDEALRSYREAMLLNQKQGLRSPWPALNLGTLLTKLGHLKEAEASLRESLREAPDFPKAHFQLGLLLQKEGRRTEAIQELHRSIAYDPSYAEPYYILGRIYEQQHELRRARSLFQKFEQLKKPREELGLAE